MIKDGQAFLVGINQYSDPCLQDFSGETSPVEDVRSFEGLLELKFSRYHPQVVLKDNPIEYHSLCEKLKELLSEKNYRDILIYFSGHGYQILDEDSGKYKGYLATSDSKLISTEDEKPFAQQNGLSLIVLSKLISEAKHLNSLILIIDACHSGHAIEDDALRLAFSSLPSNFKYCILASSLSSEESYSGEFTKALLKGLKDKSLGQITADSLVKYIKKNLTNNKQHIKDICSDASSIIIMDYPSVGQNLVLDPIKENGELVCPYRGLNPFEDDEIQAQFFFGRERDIQKIRNKLDESAFIPIIGASGSGKSSVVKAGLVQKQLRQGEEGKWHILPIIKPGDTPLQNFKLALNSLLENLEKESNAHMLTMNFIYGSEPLSVARFGNILESLRGDKKYLLVIDQFEEVFTLTPEQERETFLDLITSVAGIKDSPLKVVITMRADFLGSSLSHAALKELIEKNTVYIAPITTGLVGTIIQEPAKRQGYTVEEDLINTLIEDTTSEPGYLPLLEFTLEQLWNKNLGDPDKIIRLSTYSEETESGQSGLKKALNLHAERVYNYSDEFEKKKAELKRSAQEKEWIRLIFLRLVRTGKGDTDTRQPQERQNLLNIVQESERQKLEQVIESLIKGRLLVSDKDQIYLAHEALISGWEQFKTWRIEDREIRRTAERLEDARNEWEKDKNDQLLISRALLAQVRENWKNLKPYLPDLKATEEFYRLSDQYEKAEKLRLEKALLEAQLQLDASRVERAIAANEPIKSLTLAIQMIGKNRERLPEKLVGSVSASLRHVVEKIFTSSPSYGHTGYVNSVAFSPDGQTIVSGSDDRTVRLWKLDGTSVGNPLTGHTRSVYSVAFSPDGQTIVSGNEDNTVRLWKLDGTPLGNPFTGHTDSVYSVAFSPDGQTIVSGNGDKTVKLWKLDGTPLGNPFTGHKSYVYSVAFSPDGQTIVSGSEDNTVRLWKLDGTPEGNPFTRHTDDVNSVAFSPDGQTIVSGSKDNTVRLWKLDGTPLGNPFTGHTSYVYSVAFGPDGQTIVSGSWDNTVRLWKLDGTPLGNPFIGHTDDVNSVAFSPDGQTIASGSWDNTVRLWKLDGTPEGNPFTGHTSSYVNSVAFSPDGQTIVSGSSDNTVRLWKPDGTPLGIPFTGHTDSVKSVGFSPDGQAIVSGSYDNTVKLWKLDGTPLGNPFTGHTRYVNSVAFSPDGQTIVSGSSDKTVRLWKLDGTPEGNPFTGHTDSVYSVAFSPDGQTIVSGSWDNTVRLWKLDGTPVGNPFTGHTNFVQSVAFSPDGQTIVSVSYDKTVRLWKLDGTPVGNPFTGHTNFVQSVAFSPDGQMIVSGSSDKTVRLWTHDGTPVGNPFTGHTSSVKSVAFSPDGQTIVSGSWDGTVRLWKHVGWRDWLRTCLRRLGNNWTEDKDGTAARARLFEEGYTFAEEDEIEKAIVRFQQALQCGKPTLISEAPDEQLTPEKLEASAQRLISPILLEQGQRLARFGNFDGALAKFLQAKQFNSDLTIDPVAEAKRLTAPILKMQGTIAALQGKIEEAIALFTQAKQLVPDLDLDPEAEAQRLAMLMNILSRY